jgi:hypothetical protein
MAATLMIVVLLLAPCVAQADISPWISYQGILRDSAGDMVPDGTYELSFALWTQEVGGLFPYWTEIDSVYVSDGVFNVRLGSNNPLDGLNFDVPYWLGVSVYPETEMSPRTPLTSAPYAWRAATAAYADSCAQGDSDWEIDDTNIYNETAFVGIGTATPGVRLDVLGGNETTARFLNAGGSNKFAIHARNENGTAGSFYAGTGLDWFPGVPTAVYGRGEGTYTGGEFYSDEGNGVVATSASGTGLYAGSSDGLSAYFTGGEVDVDTRLMVNEFQMEPGTAGYVLTSDADGVGTWQSISSGASGWSVEGDDLHCAVDGNVAIGEDAPSAKLDVYDDSGADVLRAHSGYIGGGTVATIGRTQIPTSQSNVLKLSVPASSPLDMQFIECDRGGGIEFQLNGDGSINASGGAVFAGEVEVAGTMRVSGSSDSVAVFTSSSSTAMAPALSGINESPTPADAYGVRGEASGHDYWGVGGFFQGGYIGCIGYVQPSGSQDYTGLKGDVYGGSGTNYGVRAVSGGSSYLNYGIYASTSGGGAGSTHWAGYFGGNVHATGTITSGVRASKIDHPLDPENKYLLHASVESDEMLNVYNGNVVLDARGEAAVEMPEWFEALNRDFRYQLTCIGGFAPVYVAEEIRDGGFVIAGGEPGMKVSWMVTGVRHDPMAEANRVQVEMDKPAREAGKYMHPEAYGQPETMGVDYHEERTLTASGSGS